MKKIFFIVLIFCLQNGFCNNIKNGFIGTNNELIDILSKDKDFSNLLWNTVELGMENYLENEFTKTGKIEEANKAKLNKDGLIIITQSQTESFFKKYPILFTLSKFQRDEILIGAAKIVATGLTFPEFTQCISDTIIADLGECISITTYAQRAAFILCLSLAFGGDILVLAATEFAAGGVVALAIPGELEFCGNVSFAVAGFTCGTIVITNFLTCLRTQRND